MWLRGYIKTQSFFWLTVGLFVLAALWIALSLGYPGIYDENFHFGIIQLYGHQWSPFFSRQPSGANALGALTADPSFLYHYLMSFPYRIIAAFTDNQMWQIIGLRIINVLLFASSLPVYRAVLRRAKLPVGAVHLALFAFALTPVAPFLASQINYDNMIMPLAALSLWLALRLYEAKQRENILDLRLFIALAGTSMVGCMVQFLFLPFLAGTVLYGAFIVWRTGPLHNLKAWQPYAGRLLKRFASIPGIAAVAFLLIVFTLFTRSYGVNLVRYHTPTPTCDKILSVSECMPQATWRRDYEAALAKPHINPVSLKYVGGWTYRMFKYAFYTNSGGSHLTALYINASPMPLLTIPAIVWFCIGCILSLWFWRRILADYPALAVLLFFSLLFTTVLFEHNYASYLQNGQRFGINSRYLLPVLLPLEVTIIIAYSYLLRNHSRVKTTLLAVCLLLFLQGGGALTFITASDPRWYWPNSNLSTRMNAAAQTIVKPLIIR